MLISCLALAPAALSAQEKTIASSSFTWRDAQIAAEDTELDRLKRAFGQPAKHSGAANGQIPKAGPESKSPGAPAPGRRCSGFHNHPKGYILTAHHVIDKAKEIEIR